MSSFRESSTSNRSSSYSNDANEADDEGSWASPPNMSRTGYHGSSRYEGEDTRPTSSKELRGFYAYSWASEVFVICGMGSFIPITLEQLAREKGVLASDHVTPCVAGIQSPSRNSTSITSSPPRHNAQQCLLPIFGMEINTASFAMYTFSISVFLQFLVIISMSGAADHGNYRKTLLVIFAFTGAIATTLFLPIQPHTVILGAIFAIIANTCYGASSVLLNSFLPLLVRNHPDVQAESILSSDGYGVTPEVVTPEENSIHDASMIDSSASLLGRAHKADIASLSSDLASPELSVSTRISSIGVGIGYISALLVQALAIYIVWAIKSTLFSLRLVLFFVGLWWIVFTIPAAFWLRPRPGPPLHLPLSSSKTRTLIAYATYSWKSLGRSIMRARKLKDVLLFLAGWFLLSDAIATVSGTAVLFAKTSLEMKPAALALITVVVTLSGIVGAFAWPRISRYMRLKPSQTILFCICIFEIVPLYGLLGYIPIVKRWGVGGLQQGWEMYPVAVVYGFVLGGFSSFCRALFGELVPPGFEAAFYSLYAITDKGSSVFGPAIVGAITDATGEIRPAFFFLAALIAAPFPLLLFVDAERGNREGIALAKELAIDGAKTPTEEGTERLLSGEGREDGP